MVPPQIGGRHYRVCGRGEGGGGWRGGPSLAPGFRWKRDLSVTAQPWYFMVYFFCTIMLCSVPTPRAPGTERQDPINGQGQATAPTHVALARSASQNCYLLNAEIYCAMLLSAHLPSRSMTLMFPV